MSTRTALLQDIEETGMDTIKALGKRHGVSHQRISQLLSTEGISERRGYIEWRLNGFKWLTCGLCNQPFVRKTPPSAVTHSKRHFCPTCRKRNAELLEFTCGICSKKFSRTRRSVENNAKQGVRPRWCERACHGTWLGRNHGRGAR